MGVGRFGVSVSKAVTGVAATGSRGTLTGSGTVTPPLPTSDTWTKRTLTYSPSDLRRGPDGLQQGWWKGAVIRSTGDVFIAQGNPQVSGRGTFFFRNSLGYFERTNSVPSYESNLTNWWKNLTVGAIRENYEAVHDSTRNRITISDGGPYGYSSYDPVWPHIGELYYDVAVDEFFTIYPVTANTYSPVTVDDVAHFNVSGRGNAWGNIDTCLVYDVKTDRSYIFGGWSLPGYGLSYRNMTTGARTTVIATAPWPNNYTISRSTNLRGGMDYSTRQLWVLANNAELYMLNLHDFAPVWRHVPTLGNKPTVPTTMDPCIDNGVIAQFHEANQQIVAYCGLNTSVVGQGETQQRNVWVLDLRTRVWRNGLQADGPTSPHAAVCSNLFYSPSDQRIRLLTVRRDDNHPEVWDYYPSETAKGEWTQFLMPFRTPGSFSTLHFPFAQDGESKHVQQAYCPLNGRVYATVGDSPGSNTMHVHSMDLATGQWRFEVGLDTSLYTVNTWPYPFPTGFQDECLFQWVPSLQRFMLGFSISESYIDDEASLAATYAKGIWFYDPTQTPANPANAWTQDLRLFNSFEYRGDNPEVISKNYDPTTDTVYKFRGTDVRRWHIGTMTALSTVNVGSAWLTGTSGTPSFRKGQLVHDGFLYVLGTWNSTPTGVVWVFGRLNLTTLTMERLSAPPVEFIGRPTLYSTLEARIEISGNKLVWIVTTGPDGIVYGMLLYDIAGGVWTLDKSRPPLEPFYCNSACALPDGRIGMGGAAFSSPRQKYYTFYKAPQ